MNTISITPAMARANQARKEEAEFRHKAAHTLTELGWTTCAIAGELAVTQRRVQALAKQPCEALAEERREWAEREARERLAHTSASFFSEAFPEEEPPLQLDGSLSTREKVQRYLDAGKVSQAEVARRLGISRQAVSKHAQALSFSINEQSPRTVHTKAKFGRPSKLRLVNITSMLAG